MVSVLNFNWEVNSWEPEIYLFIYLSIDPIDMNAATINDNKLNVMISNS